MKLPSNFEWILLLSFILSIYSRGQQTMASGLDAAFYKKVLLECSNACLLMYCLLVFSCYGGRVSSLSKDLIAPIA